MTDKTAEAAWAEAFAKAQSEFPEIQKTETADAGSYTYQYATLASVVKAVREALAKNGLSVAQDVQAQQGFVSVSTRIYHAAGHHETFGPCSLPYSGNNQQAGSAITYARRYALSAALNVAAEEDKDGHGSQEGSDWGAPEIVCPACGAPVRKVNSTKPKAPKWACSNDNCTGGKGNRPWASWDDEPPSGAETSQARESAKAEPQTEEVSPTSAASSVSPTSSEPYVKALDEAVTTKKVVRNVTLDLGKLLAKLNTLALKNDLPPLQVSGNALPADVWRAIENADVRLLALACEDLELTVEVPSAQESLEVSA